ncbi:MAG: hypothetical protein ACI843_000984 [Psychrobacter glaciei]|jgi:hypothetical protein
MYLKNLLTILVAIILCACDPGDEITSIDPKRSSSSSELALIEGVYKTNKFGDLHYLYISNNAKVTSYNYEGDSVDNGLNCYSKVTSASGINGIFNNKTITYDSNNEEYTLPSPALTISFKYSVSQGMRNFRIGNDFGSAVNGTSSSPVFNVYLGHEARDVPVDAPIISDIKGMLCN